MIMISIIITHSNNIIMIIIEAESQRAQGASQAEGACAEHVH